MKKTLALLAPGTSEYQQAGVLPGIPCGLLLGLEHELRTALGDRAGDLRTVYTSYPASFGPATGGGPTYAQSVEAGALQMVADMDNAVSREPGLRLVLAGYSQGAQVVWRAISILINKAKYGEKVQSGNGDPRGLLAAIVGVLQFGNPTRAPGQAYPGATRTEIGQGISAKYLSQKAQEQWLPNAGAGGWFEYVVPGDVYASTEVDRSYADEVYESVEHLAFPWVDMAEFTQMCLTFVQNGGLVGELIKDGQPVNAMRVVQTAYTFLWFYLGDFPHVHYHDRPVFEGSTALASAASKMAIRLGE